MDAVASRRYAYRTFVCPVAKFGPGGVFFWLEAYSVLKRSAFLGSAAAAAASLTAVRGEATMLSPLWTPAQPWGPDAVAHKVSTHAYASQTTTEFISSFQALSSTYILISLDIFGAVGNERYASVWVKRTLPFAWLCEIGVSLAGLNQIVNQYVGQGFVPTIFAITGDSANQTCAIVMQQTYNYWYWYYGLTDGASGTVGTFQHQDAVLRSQNYDLATVAVYGDAGAPLYLAAWSGNGTATGWADGPADGSATLTTRVANELKAGYRPSLISRNAHGVYASIFRNDSVGPWTWGHELSPSAYAKLFATETAKGYYPISLRAGGSSTSPVYAAVFAATDLPVPAPRKLTVTGKAVKAYQAIENEIVAFMLANEVRAGQLTVAKNGVVQYERAFTWAEPGYPITQTSSLFRLASCSKAFVEAAVQTLFDQKKLTPGTLVFKRLGFSNPGDPRSSQITVQELLDHTGGYDDSVVPDPVFSMRQIALDLHLTSPLSLSQFVHWVYAQPLQFNPGAKYAYSNTGYVILSYLVSVVTGLSFIEFVQNEVMKPLGVTSGVELTRTDKSLRLAGEVLYDDDEVGPSALTVTSPVLQPAAYGGDGLLYEVGQGASSIATTATHVTTLIHTWLVWGNGKRPAPGNWTWQRDGSMPGTTSTAFSRGNDGFDFCFIFNTRNWLSPSASQDTLCNSINTLLDAFDPAVEPAERSNGQPLPYRGEELLRRRRAASNRQAYR
jgi:CubicO group peptidase (beta-lactamase class C family)